jgi:putative phosphoribosyl transferase
MVEVVDEPALRNRVHVFEDRLHAGRLLAEKLREYEEKERFYVLAIPAGGVQVALVIAKRLKLPLDLVVTRKLHVPWNKEAGFGAVSRDGTVFLNEPLVASLGLTSKDIERCVATEKEIVQKRIMLFRGDRPFPDLKNKTVIIVDDGLASGFSMLATVEAIKRKHAEEIVVAVPTAPISAIKRLRPHAGKIVCLNVRSGQFFAVADPYRVWYDLEDEDVIEILEPAGLK